jgi:hypothetical protein
MAETEIKTAPVPEKPNWRTKYKSLHLWMLIPMSVMQWGIFKDYWGDFRENAWAVHIHYLTGTIWYIYLIIQPWFATHGHMPRHRTNGIIGMFIAGGVCLTALSMMHRDIANAARSLAMPERFGPFEPWFFYGVAAIEIVMMTAFGFTVIKSITQRKQVENHAWWLISSVFIIMMPALARGIQNVYMKMHIKDFPNIDIMGSVYLSQALIILMIILAAWKYKKLKHPATFLAIGVNMFCMLLEPIGRSQVVQDFLNNFVKG